jgi:hypothetical protein
MGASSQTSSEALSRNVSFKSSMIILRVGSNDYGQQVQSWMLLGNGETYIGALFYQVDTALHLFAVIPVSVWQLLPSPVRLQYYLGGP